VRQGRLLSFEQTTGCQECISNESRRDHMIGVAQYLSLEGELRGWWHPTQFGSRLGRNTTDALMWLKSIVAQNRHENMDTALIMADVAAAFPATQPSTVLHTLAALVDPMIYRWIADWLSDRYIVLTIDGLQSPRQESRCGIPQGSPLSPVLFSLVCATALKRLPPGASYVDDCSWAIPFSSPRQLPPEAGQLLDTVNDRLKQYGLSLDTGKLEIAFISKNKRTSKR
jgi:hypothetical protein